MDYEVRTEAVCVDGAGDVGVQIRSRRIVLKLTQQQLADRAGVGRRFIVDLEAGKSTVQFETVAKVVAALDMEFLIRMPALDELDLVRNFRRSRAPQRLMSVAERIALDAARAPSSRKDL